MPSMDKFTSDAVDLQEFREFEILDLVFKAFVMGAGSISNLFVMDLRIFQNLELLLHYAVMIG